MASIDYLKKYWQYFTAGIVILSIVFVWLFSQSNKQSDFNSVDLTEIKSTQASSDKSDVENVQSEKIETIQIYIDIKGAVAKPGIYQVSNSSRVADVVKLAGGMLENAEMKGVNLAQKLTDEMIIYVPFIGEAMENLVSPQIDSNLADTDNKKINLNTATEAELQTISGIGEKKSKDIINYRDANGSFQAIDDLKNISGIGAATIEKIKDYVTIE
ncbi:MULTISPECIES: helix-hairpin-helix domain-containing protein [unclassified Enterococcus]|uniref:helix-hairpin-helix domain-containing protein n=1 Tax=unclassified Enterococcus TaxID=2608891 RepID=UPI001551B6EC|nr:MULTISPECIES: helix-hairpin-helix domain-containing protein [unclassified Enterococcus]MBS7576470.1 helix-hairpin-helix domain-containing protein [Enterococcus sp. MMGLQ5-2]MBS7583702.1 helix-hairpin-helix domain-containing protein [Enterococcus sp. MMGLQ5-1]NPD11563.1 hypothetical protein [Enterococcus sp. MMGLQ5-1]NPD36307.1 hypothetical protein [Enterococcus sp. MMGLQ5-2]